MIRRNIRRRRYEFDHPILRAAADFVVSATPQNPYRKGAPSHTLYDIGFTHAQHALSHTAVIPQQDLLDAADRFLQALGEPIPSRQPLREK